MQWILCHQADNQSGYFLSIVVLGEPFPDLAQRLDYCYGLNGCTTMRLKRHGPCCIMCKTGSDETIAFAVIWFCGVQARKEDEKK
jgi:hypothetical protein